MNVKQRVIAIAVFTVASRVFAEPIDLDPYIPPTVRTDVVRARIEKAQAQDMQNEANAKNKLKSTAKADQTGSGKVRGESRNDSPVASKSGASK
jgi:hypothetical protein